MSEDLNNEIEAINSIYGYKTIHKANDNAKDDIYILSIPQHRVSLRLLISPQYPDVPIQILGTETTGDGSRKGYGSHVLDLAKETLQAVFTPGSVCIFDLLQDLESAFVAEETPTEDNRHLPTRTVNEDQLTADLSSIPPIPETPKPTFDEPSWILSSAITEKKSVFLARACTVKSAAQAKVYVAHLVSTDKRVARATHNITAYRIHSSNSSTNTAQITFQDCDDDGETAAGGRLLHLLQVMSVWDVVVVVSRWYGGVKLGPDRFRLINTAAREAIVAGGWIDGKHK